MVEIEKLIRQVGVELADIEDYRKEISTAGWVPKSD